jgi:hypothetical protein
MAKVQTPSDEKFEKQDFDLFDALSAIDRKDYGYYDRLTDEQKKKFVPFMLIKWFSSVKSNPTLQQFHVLSTNEFANKHLFNENVIQNPKLQWLMLCAAGLGQGKQFHQWIPQVKESISDLRDKAKPGEIFDYYKKVYKDVNESTLKEISQLYVEQQNKKVYLAKLYPDLKIDDIEVLSQFVTDADILKYEQDNGN